MRIELTPGKSVTAADAPFFRSLFTQLASEADSGEVQIDYECPDRLLPDYIAFLRALREEGHPWKLSVSALGHWAPRAKDFVGLVEEITPMFYDLDPRGETWSERGLPSLVSPDISEQLQRWKGCPIPWRAGLPNFSRVTVCDRDGRSRGNLRSWEWNDLLFSPLLSGAESTSGEIAFRTKADGTLGKTPIQEGETIVCRYPDRDALEAAESAARTAGAQGVVFFRMADSGDMSGYGVRDLGRHDATEPTLRLRQDAEGRLLLTNESDIDLPPRMTGSIPGYVVELKAPAPLWREAIAGDFARVSAGEGSPASSQASFGWGSGALRLEFASLRAGKSLRTGLVQRVPDSQTIPIQWRILNSGRENIWHSLGGADR